MNIRPGTVSDAAGIARVHVLVQQDTYRNIFPEAMLKAADLSGAEASKREKLFQDSQGATCTYIAETDTSEIIGYATGGPKRDGPADYEGELYNIFVLSEYQWQGIGSALFLRVVEFLRRKGHTSLLLWVVEGTDAVGYYEHLSGQKIDERQENMGGHPLNLMCYGWKDILELHEKLKGGLNSSIAT